MPVQLTASQGPLPAGLRLNFRGVPLEMVLSYLSEAAGFIISLEVQPKGTIDLWSDRPVTIEEAYDLLTSALAKNGYAAIRKGRVGRRQWERLDPISLSNNSLDDLAKDIG